MWSFYHLEFKNYLNEPLYNLQRAFAEKTNILILK